MRMLLSWIVVVAVCASGAWAVDIEWVTIGYPGNAAELSGGAAGGSGSAPYCGGVDYGYDIGMFEVTAGQYTEFLNAVAATDTYGLYDERMDVNDGDAYSRYGCNIKRGGYAGRHSYYVAEDWANRPVNFVSWGDAARFANWLHNGQPSGVQDLTTTEDGAYFLNGAMDESALAEVTRGAEARVFIPSEDEWYKAAYYDGVAGMYFDFPTGSNAQPSNDLIDPDPGNNATYRPIGNDSTIGSPYYRTEVGAHENSQSPCGTFDQGGNVGEWNETVVYSYDRGVRGGSYFSSADQLRANDRYNVAPTDEYGSLGFRVASAEAVCGDGMVQWWSELCDDGNTVDGDGCGADCVTEVCGNGILQPDLGEECDDGNLRDEDGCNSDCQEEYCGDGVLLEGIGEQCDDGNDVGGDGCDEDCRIEGCGNGDVEPELGEECDDRNTADDDGCTGDCQLEYCGDGVVQAGIGEVCDDGNTVTGDGCDADCIGEICGNGIPQPLLDEECDDGNTVDGDGCNASCVIEYCGDGLVQPLIGESCEDGNTADDDGCDSNCTWTACGNGVRTEGEQCDDGNTLDGDGCSHDCQIQSIPCSTHLDCVFINDNACEWNFCGDGSWINGVQTTPGECITPIPRKYGDICGSDFRSPPNGTAGKLTDIICTLDAFGAGNLPNCPNADIAATNAADCPHGNGIVNLTDILKVLDCMNREFFCDCPLDSEDRPRTRRERRLKPAWSRG